MMELLARSARYKQLPVTGERICQNMTISTGPSTYEALYARMQEIVARLENGELPLAEAMGLYEEGVQIAAACQRILDNAELRVQKLLIGEPNHYEDQE